MTELTDLMVTPEDIEAAARDIVLTENKIKTGNNMAALGYGEMRGKVERVADLIAKGVVDGLSREEIADALTASKWEGRAWQKSEIAHWLVARSIMQMKDLPDNVILGRVAKSNPKKRGWDGFGPVFDADGHLVMEKNGEAAMREVKSMITLARAACDHSGVGTVQATIKGAKTGKSAIEAVEALFDTPKDPPSLTKILKSMEGASIRATTPGLDKGDTAKNTALLANIKANLAKVTP